MQEFKTVEVNTDLLIIGPGMAGSGACVEGAHWAKENNIKVMVVDKAAMERSGAVGMGLSAIVVGWLLRDFSNILLVRVVQGSAVVTMVALFICVMIAVRPAIASEMEPV